MQNCISYMLSNTILLRSYCMLRYIQTYICKVTCLRQGCMYMCAIASFFVEDAKPIYRICELSLYR